MKIAILILIHEFSEQQKILIKRLSKDFELFIHIDKRSNINPINISELSKNIHVFKKYKVFWGHYNQIRATLHLFKEAESKKKYSRFIFISGADVPIKSNKYIKQFFENNNKEYLYFEKLPRKCWKNNGGFDRIDYFHFKSMKRGHFNIILFILLNFFNKINLKLVIPLLKKLHIKRSRMGINYYGGPNWMDLTDNCVSQILKFIDTNPKFLKRFKFTQCADEIFFQTIICDFINNINIENRCLRYIDWESGPEYPRIFRNNDFKRIYSSDCLFARKFNINTEADIIYKLYECTKK